MRDEDTPGRRMLLQAAGDVDGVAGHADLTRRPDAAGEHRARVDADPDVDVQAVARTEHVERGPEVEGGADGPFRVVLPRRVDSPDTHHRVADVLVDPASVLFDAGVDRRPQL